LISTISDNDLNDNDIIINNWVAEDLKIKIGDSINIKYYEIGPLRQLIEKQVKFAIGKIVPITGKYADKDLMPSLPGMSAAGPEPPQVSFWIVPKAERTLFST